MQRIGRCARWGGKGEIYVYDLPEKKSKYLPYSKELTENTYKKLQMIQGKNMDYFLANNLIQSIVGGFEEKIIREIKNNFSLGIEQIKKSWREGGKENARELIRDIRSINVALLPAHFTTESLYKYETLSINPYSIMSQIRKKIQDIDGEIPQFILKLEESAFDYDEKKELSSLNYEEIAYENIIALNSDLIGYSREFGLDFENIFSYQSKEIKREDRFQYALKRDTYEQHISWMLEIYNEKYMSKISYPLRRIQLKKYKKFDFQDILKFIIIMHDYGKLNIIWQKIMNDYQSEKSIQNNEIWQKQMLAHTDFDPNNKLDKEIMADVLKKSEERKNPPHAGIGALATLVLLPYNLSLENSQENGSLVGIVLSAILRHHGAFTTQSPQFEISREGVELSNYLLKKNTDKFSVSYQKDNKAIKYEKMDLSCYVLQFNNSYEAFLYYLFVRVLRLCDQHSFDKNPLNVEENL